MAQQLKQLNVSVEKDVDEQIRRLAAKSQRSKRHTVELAVRTLAALMEKMAEAVEPQDDDIAELFLRLADEKPSDFVGISNEIQFGRVAGQPAVRLSSGWVVYEDADRYYDLLAVEESTGRVAEFIDGKMHPLKPLPTPDEIALNGSAGVTDKARPASS